MSAAEDFNQLPPEQQLNVALETINAFAGWVANVDTKIATLSTAQLLLALFMASQRLSLAWPANSPLTTIALVAQAIFVISFLVTVRHVGAALRPRLSTGPELNHFVFPSVARATTEVLGKESTDSLIRQAWGQAHALSVIAVARYRHFSKALSWAGLGVLAVLVWLVASSQIS